MNSGRPENGRALARARACTCIIINARIPIKFHHGRSLKFTIKTHPVIGSDAARWCVASDTWRKRKRPRRSGMQCTCAGWPNRCHHQKPPMPSETKYTCQESLHFRAFIGESRVVRGNRNVQHLSTARARDRRHHSDVRQALPPDSMPSDTLTPTRTHIHCYGGYSGPRAGGVFVCDAVCSAIIYKMLRFFHRGSCVDFIVPTWPSLRQNDARCFCNGGCVCLCVRASACKKPKHGNLVLTARYRHCYNGMMP